MKKKLQVFIPTYNRPNLILKSLNSVLNQTYSDFEVIVSDNSSNELTENLFKKITNGRVLYRKRNKVLSGIEHLNAILDEVESEYFIIFHDDDVMHPQMINELLKNLSENESIIAIGCNALVSNHNKWRKAKFGNFKKDIIIKSPFELLEGYVSLNKYVPFPSYMYKKIVSENLRLNIENGGKYSDLAFLIEILDYGKIAFLSKTLMTYFIHNNQDTSLHNFSDKSKLIEYLQIKIGLSKNDLLIKKMRSQNIYMDLKYKYNNRLLNRRYKKRNELILKYLNFIHFTKIYFFFLQSKIKFL